MDVNLTAVNLLLIPLITGVSLLLRLAGIPKRFTGIVEMFLGIIFAFLTMADAGYREIIIIGLYSALAGRGLISTTVNAANGALKKHE